MTAQAVADGKLSNEELGKYTRRMDEIKRRLNEGTLSFSVVMIGLQVLIENRSLVAHFPLWRTITLGKHRRISAYLRALEKANISMGWGVKEALKEIPLSKKKEDVDLVLLDIRDLNYFGEDDRITYPVICEKAKAMGLELCPPETALELRLAYLPAHDAPRQNRQAMVVATTPIATSATSFGVAILGEHKLGPSLGFAEYQRDPEKYDGLWDNTQRFVFVKPNKQA